MHIQLLFFPPMSFTTIPACVHYSSHSLSFPPLSFTTIPACLHYSFHFCLFPPLSFMTVPACLHYSLHFCPSLLCPLWLYLNVCIIRSTLVLFSFVLDDHTCMFALLVPLLSFPPLSFTIIPACLYYTFHFCPFLLCPIRSYLHVCIIRSTLVLSSFVLGRFSAGASFGGDSGAFVWWRGAAFVSARPNLLWTSFTPSCASSFGR